VNDLSPRQLFILALAVIVAVAIIFCVTVLAEASCGGCMS